MAGTKRTVSFADLARTMHRLRAPGGCPWDAKQTHTSLLRYLREETAEVCDAVRQKDWANLKEELGDVLLQVLFHSELASERGDFDVNDVISGLQSKLIRRHPHVFGHRRGEKLSMKDLSRQWKEIKEQEKKKKRKER